MQAAAGVIASGTGPERGRRRHRLPPTARHSAHRRAARCDRPGRRGVGHRRSHGRRRCRRGGARFASTGSARDAPIRAGGPMPIFRCPSPRIARRSWSAPTPTKRCGRPCASSSTRPARAPRSTASRCSTPPPSRTTGWCASTSPRRASPSTAPPASRSRPVSSDARSCSCCNCPRVDFRRQDVFAWLASAPIRHDGRWAPSAAGSACPARPVWSAVAPTGTSCSPRWPSGAGCRSNPPQRTTRTSRSGASTSGVVRTRGARELRTFVLSLIDRLEAAARTPASWSARADWARQLLTDLLGGPELRASWPPAERKAAERVDLALDRLAALDEIESTVDLDVFTRTLTVELESDLGRVGRFGEGVLVGSIAMGLGIDLDLVVIAGHGRGLLPGAGARRLAPARRTSVRPRRARSPAARSGRPAAPRAPRASRGSRAPGAQRSPRRPATQQRPGPVPVGARRRVAARRVERGGHPTCGGPRSRGSPRGLVRRGRAQRSRSRRPTRSTGSAASSRQALAGRSSAAVGGRSTTTSAEPSSVLDHRESSTFTRFDGNLAGLADPVAGRARHVGHQPRALGRVPVRLLVAGPAPRRTGREPRGGAPDHAARPGQPRPRGARACSSKRCSPADAGRAACVDDGAAGSPRRDRSGGLRPLRGRRSDRARRSSGGATVARSCCTFERFADEDDGTERERDAARGRRAGVRARRRSRRSHFPLPDGRTLPCAGEPTGSSRGATARIHVVDYKTGRIRSEKELSAENPTERARLQLPVYGLAARPAPGTRTRAVRADYWFVTSREGSSRSGYEVTAEVLDAGQPRLSV